MINLILKLLSDKPKSHSREETIVGVMQLSGQQRSSPQFSDRTVKVKKLQQLRRVDKSIKQSKQKCQIIV
jgi:hypothetical protein